MHKKPFHSDHSDRKPFGNKEDKPFHKSFDKKEDKPFRKSSGDKEDKPFRKSFDKKEDKPFRKSFGDKEDKPFRKSFGNKEEKPFKKSFGNKEDKPFGKFRKEERPFRKSEDQGEDRPFRKSFQHDGDKPFKKPFKKPFAADGARAFKKPFDKEGDNGFRKSFDKDGGKPFKKSFDKDKAPEEKRPNRYANAFGKLDDEELAAHQKKQSEKRELREQQEEVTFSKELSRWEEDAPKERQFGKSDIKPKKKEIGEDGKPKRNRHDAQSRFKKQFDDENPHEKAYTSKSGKKEEPLSGPDNLEGKSMPLNKYIAHCDVCSRRDAVTLVKEGKVTVNGELITEPGFKVSTEDEITLNGNRLTIQKNLIYILMNKPKGFITTTDDPKGRRTVMEMVENVIEERVFPVGRLDRNTTGLLLLTNDGELTQKLAHPKYGVKKVYKATLDKPLSKTDFEKIKEGLILEDGKADVDQLEYLDSKNEIGLEIHSGKNRIVRRIFESLGYEVEKLDRVMYAGLTKKHILRGKWRFLTKQEVINLKHLH
jgi:23S rRNA pseudouridine2605 synthase